MVDKQRGVGASGLKPKLLQKGGDALVPGSRCLLQPVQGAGEQTHMIKMSSIDEASGLLAEDLLREVAMQESIRHIHLMYRP